MNIRRATYQDVGSIADLHAASWRYAYRGALSEKFLAGDIVADRKTLWEQRLSQPSNQLVIVAESR